MTKPKKKDADIADESALLAWLWDVAADNSSFDSRLSAGLTLLAHLKLERHCWTADSERGKQVRREIEKVNRLLSILAMDDHAPSDVRLQAARAVLA